KGNPYFSSYHNGASLPTNSYQGLADFLDFNQDASYDPTDGDIPMAYIRGCEDSLPLTPDEILWFVFNDVKPHTQSGMDAAHIEIQCTVFAYNCKESPLSNSIFVRYRTINRAFEDINQFYFGNFTDFEIGNGSDDFFGSDSERSMIFAYNGDNEDEGGFGANPPTMSVDMYRGPRSDLNNAEIPLSHVMPVAGIGPANPFEYYNLLQGLYENGSVSPNNGFLYDGNPNDPADWSELSAVNTPGDRKVVASYGPFKLQPGAGNEMILGYSFFQAPKGSVQENLDGMYLQADAAQAIFDNCFTAMGQCTQAVSATVERSSIPITVSPNPTSGLLTVKMPAGLVSDLEIVSLNGQLMHKSAVTPSANQATLDLSTLPAGFYLLNALNAGARLSTEKIVVMR
ncbi:MAG: T9SS type A sorting domain-containing protein, partial [Saprospiraceae bacterium]|nr:T9SS type A sorting domain-containing protein [Saprospiraceae bacterium]